jgi:hypothetical protein
LANGEKAIHGPFYFHPTDSSNLAASGLAVYDEAAYKGEFNKGNYEAAVDLPPDDGHRLGIIYVGQGLSPEVVAEIEANDPS